MQTPPQAPSRPEPALAPATAPPPPVSITTVGADGRPLTLTIPSSEADVVAVLAQREELAGQLSNVSSRRRSLAEELKETHDPAARAGLEGRLALLDQRILQIETDLATTGRQLSAAPAELVALTERRDQSGDDGDFEEGMFAGGLPVLVIAALILFFSRRRSRRRSPPILGGGESAQRLERLERGLDAIAVEIERISEGQRFVTKLLSESQGPFGQAQRLAKPAPAEREDPMER